MREILFRGKREDNGEWVTGFYCSYPHQYSAFLHPHIFVSSYDIEREAGECIAYPVIAETVGQYTGLTDKDGKRIFEGDIVDFGDPTDKFREEGTHSYYTVEWKDTGFSVVYTSDISDTLDSFFTKCCAVVGNIYDNPELMEAK